MSIEEILNAHMKAMLAVEAGYEYPPTIAETCMMH